MGIVNQQLIIGDKVISNDIRTNRKARSVTMRNGYYFESKYPDNRTYMTSASVVVGANEIVVDDDGKIVSKEEIAVSKTAGRIT